MQNFSAANSATHRLRVFLCHSNQDKPAVRRLHRRLQNDGLNAWLDEMNLLPGQDWELEIQKTVQNSDVVIVCLSRKSINTAGFIHKEIKFALDVADKQPEGSIFLIPARLDDCDLPHRLSRWQWVNLFESQGYDKLTRSLRLCVEKLNSPSQDKFAQKGSAQYFNSSDFVDFGDFYNQLFTMNQAPVRSTQDMKVAERNITFPLSATVSIETARGTVSPIFRKNVSLPASHEQVFSTTSDNQNSVEIHLVYGESGEASKNISLRKFRFDGIERAPRGTPQIRLQFQVDIDQRLSVSALDLATGRNRSLGSVDLPKGLNIIHKLTITLEEAGFGITKPLTVSGRQIEVKVPAGIATGKKIRIRGYGRPGGPNIPAGDLYLEVEVSQHALFTRQGNDLLLRLPVSKALARTGGKLAIPVLGNESVHLTIPPQASTRQRIRLRGLGIPYLNSNGRGDLFALIEVYDPRKMPTDIQLQLRLIERALRTSSR